MRVVQGWVIAATALAFAGFGIACGDHHWSPVVSGPSPVALVSLTGWWTGDYSPACPPSAGCGSVVGPVPSPQPISLLLRQTGSALSGQINLGGWLSLVADVDGS